MNTYWTKHIKPLLDFERTTGLTAEYMRAFEAAHAKRHNSGGFVQGAKHAIFYACDFSFDERERRDGETRQAMDPRRIY